MLKVSDKYVIGECELDKYTFENRLAKVTFCKKGVVACQLKWKRKLYRSKANNYNYPQK